MIEMYNIYPCIQGYITKKIVIFTLKFCLLSVLSTVTVLNCLYVEVPGFAGYLETGKSGYPTISEHMYFTE